MPVVWIEGVRRRLYKPPTSILRVHRDDVCVSRRRTVRLKGYKNVCISRRRADCGTAEMDYCMSGDTSILIRKFRVYRVACTINSLDV